MLQRVPLRRRPRQGARQPVRCVLAKYRGGFIGLLRPDLYERMLAALPPGVLRVNRDVQRIEQDEAGVRLHMADGEVITADVLVGADGIDSLVRRTLWGDTPKREHNLHIFGGYTLDGNAIEGAGKGLAVLHHSRTVQGSWTAIRSKGRDGFQRRVLSAYDAAQPFTGDLHAAATAMGAEFPAPLPQLIAATHAANVQRWVLRDRKPLKQWSKGRATIVGDAAHPTSPYAAYGAGMATEDGYFLGRQLADVDLSDYAAIRAALDAFETPRKPHTARQVQQAFILGKVFHHAPAPLRVMRDAILDRTPLLQSGRRVLTRGDHRPARRYRRGGRQVHGIARRDLGVQLSVPASSRAAQRRRAATSTIGCACPLWSPHTRQSVERELAGQEQCVLAFWCSRSGRKNPQPCLMIAHRHISRGRRSIMHSDADQRITQMAGPPVGVGLRNQSSGGSGGQAGGEGAAGRSSSCRGPVPEHCLAQRFCFGVCGDKVGRLRDFPFCVGDDDVCLVLDRRAEFRVVAGYVRAGADSRSSASATVGSRAP